ncbi:MAG TPA: glycosyltransferase [Thermoanaerobaculia bacterium]|nr:glycosyltransferase [Thermoanaerobaculia bacterium]
MNLLAAAAGAVLALWIGLWIVPALRWPRELSLGRAAAAGRGDATERVVALVPARDEAALLPLTLPSLLAQDRLAGAVLADDGSADGTAEAARDAAGEPSCAARLEVIRLDDRTGECERPEGWSGKVWAQSRALERAVRRFGGFEWLLLVDADIRLRPGALRDLLAVARAERRDLVSVMARLRAVSLWERLLVPPFVYFFQLLYPFRLVRRERSRVAAAAGGCVLVRRAALERAGGFAAISDRLIDDVALAQAVKRSGGRLWLGIDDGIESVRPYDTLAELWRMIARNAFVQLGFRWSLLGGTLLGLALAFVSPPVGVAAGVWAGSPVAASAFGLAWLIQAAALAPAVRHHRAGWPFALTLPLAAALYGAMTASAAWAHLRGRTSRWRGRVYGGGATRPSHVD